MPRSASDFRLRPFFVLELKMKFAFSGISLPSQTAYSRVQAKMGPGWWVGSLNSIRI